jgi:hypothetical protein
VFLCAPCAVCGSYFAAIAVIIANSTAFGRDTWEKVLEAVHWALVNTGSQIRKDKRET